MFKKSTEYTKIKRLLKDAGVWKKKVKFSHYYHTCLCFKVKKYEFSEIEIYINTESYVGGDLTPKKLANLPFVSEFSVQMRENKVIQWGFGWSEKNGATEMWSSGTIIASDGKEVSGNILEYKGNN